MRVEKTSPEIKKMILKGLEDARKGNFASEKEVKDLFKKYRLTPRKK